jgi:Protein of unknown function (DUF2442)
MVTDKEVEAANKRAAERLSTTPTATAAYYDQDEDRVIIELSNGLSIMFRPQDAEELEHASPEQLSEISISPSGFGIHFPNIDADIYLPGLLEGFLGSRQWMAERLGKAGGGMKSSVQMRASKENGKLGGRPKKVRA